MTLIIISILIIAILTIVFGSFYFAWDDAFDAVPK